MLKYILKKILTLSVLAFIVISFFIIANINTYKQLTKEKRIAQLIFTPIQAQEFNAIIQLDNECEQNIYRLYGDEWRIDAQFLKWKSWPTLFGVDAMYRIDRLSGRYKNIDDENAKKHISYDLKPKSTLNLSKIAERYDNKFPPVDTVYGSSAYEDMKPNTKFTVYRSQSGILIREEILETNSVETHCEDKSVWWKNMIIDLDQKIFTLIHSIKNL